MASTEKGYTIPIYIQPVEGGEGGAVLGAPVQPSDSNEAQKKAADGVKSNANAAKAMVAQMAGKVANTALDNFGNITGDYIAQQNIKTAISEVTAVAGAAALGPVGIAVYVVDKLIQGYNYISGLKRSERDAKFAQQRVMITTNRA